MGRPEGHPIPAATMHPARLLAASALLGVIAVGPPFWGDSGSGARPAGAQGTVTVAVGDFFFCDPSLAPGACQTVVSAGDTVTWEYLTGSEGHTVTHCGDSCDTPTSTPLWDSQGLSPGQTFSYTFSAPGTYLYLCRFHPAAMRAVVVVEAPPTATATQAAPQPAASPTSEPSLTPTASPTSGPSLTATPSQPARSSTAAPTSEPPLTPTPSSGDQEDGGIASWVLILVGVGGGIVLLGGGVLALRRLR